MHACVWQAGTCNRLSTSHIIMEQQCKPQHHQPAESDGDERRNCFGDTFLPYDPVEQYCIRCEARTKQIDAVRQALSTTSECMGQTARLLQLSTCLFFVVAPLVALTIIMSIRGARGWAVLVGKVFLHHKDDTLQGGTGLHLVRVLYLYCCMYHITVGSTVAPPRWFSRLSPYVF